MDLKALEKIASAEKTTIPSTAASDSTEKSTETSTPSAKSTAVKPTAKTQHQKKQSNGENH